MDPIRDLPDGGTSVPLTYFRDGYCAPTALITGDMPGWRRTGAPVQPNR